MKRSDLADDINSIIQRAKSKGITVEEIYDVLGAATNTFHDQDGYFKIIVEQWEAIREIELARRHQKSPKDWEEWEDGLEDGELIEASNCYATKANKAYAPGVRWPPGFPDFAPGTPRENLIEAAAYLVAEIERIDRKREG
ncbi:hypothetical protein [uncultured Pelagimonas sp.]|uniref:hypothetical protein n=1 Tax=uncultured Pelagimonas sp. TaxID=1618102 RepID=UPI00260CD748|nr:hypothetical protein [uncultured Pelagimonas sp.]